MYLKKLEIYGFKSFADKINIDFKDGITAIVGPNGSGKSNVSDAIKWVLGEQRVKSLRGSKMEDIIFSGTEMRKSLGYAEVTLTVDNESGVFPIEFSEVSVTRRLYRSGDSEYYLNKSLCRLKDIQDLFSDTGLGKEGYSIIGQGKIDHIVSSNTQERRLLLEEAAGIVKYKYRKLESERKLEKTQDNLFRITDIIAELEKQLPTLEKQAKKAMAYLDLRDTLKKVELNIFLHKVDQIKAELVKLNEDKDGIQANIIDKRKELLEKDAEYQKLRREIQELDEKINECNQKNLELNETHQKNNTAIQVSLTKIENNKNNSNIIEKEMEQVEEANKNLLEKIAELTNNIDAMKRELAQKGEELDNLKVRKLEIENIERASVESYTQKRDTLDTIEKSIATLFNEINIIENKNIYRKDHLESSRKRLQDIQSTLDENKISKSGLSSDNQSIEEQINTISREVTTKKQKVQFAQEKIDVMNKELRTNENHYNMISSKHNLMINNEDLRGYQNSVKELLKEKKRNTLLQSKLHDIVGNVLDVPKKYALAIETALGNAIHNVITENEDTAHECIRILSKNKWGRATFLPLNIIKGQLLSIDSTLKSQNGYIDIACNLIEFNKMYTGIFQSLLGRVLIVDDLNAAKSISKLSNYKYKIVTLQGEIFFPGGAIVGGIQKHNSTSIIQRKQEIQDLATNMEMTKEQIKHTKTEINNLVDFTNKERPYIESLQTKLNELTMEKRLVEQKLIQMEQFVTNEIKNSEVLRSQMIDTQATIEKDDCELTVLREKAEVLKARQFELEASSILEKDETLASEGKELDIKIMEITLYNAKLEEKQYYLQSQLEDIRNMLQENTNKITSKANEMIALSNENDKLQSEIESSDKLIQSYEEKKMQIHKNYEEYNHSKLSKNNTIDLLQERIKELNSENVIVNEAFNKMEMKINSRSTELEHLQQSIYETYQMNYAMSVEYRQPITNMNEEIKIMKEYKDKIKALGEVNIGAMEQYKEVKERNEFLTFQRDDLMKAKDSLTSIIGEIALNMQSQFLEQFHLIEKEFSTTFQKLFNGGDAHLLLEDPTNIMETGIEIEVQPPGKKLKNITLLSGGEKALTAIALLFAIINIKPTPFCVLDEIDAALDDSNVDRFSNFLQKVSKENQFITITHRKGTMEIADRLYGISMGKDGVSKVVSVEVTQMLKDEVTA